MKKALMKLELHKSQSPNKYRLSSEFFSVDILSYKQKIIKKNNNAVCQSDWQAAFLMQAPLS